MTALALRVIVDWAAAPSVEVAIGGGWARVTVAGPPAADWGTHLSSALRRANAMLGVAGRHAVGAPPRVGVHGPDAPADPRAIAEVVLHAWAVATGPAAAPAEREGSPPAHNPGAEQRAAPSQRGPPAPPGAAGPTDRVNTRRGNAEADEELRAYLATVAQLATLVGSHARSHGSAPKFGAEHPAARARAHNYIRSVASCPTASDAFVEAVRRRIADSS